tara:strand:- start:4202 stop:4516 length:315 start_codon:yes stop_codon:yes gene_type:complete
MTQSKLEVRCQLGKQSGKSGELYVAHSAFWKAFYLLRPSDLQFAHHLLAHPNVMKFSEHVEDSLFPRTRTTVLFHVLRKRELTPELLISETGGGNAEEMKSLKA